MVKAFKAFVLPISPSVIATLLDSFYSGLAPKQNSKGGKNRTGKPHRGSCDGDLLKILAATSWVPPLPGFFHNKDRVTAIDKNDVGK
jgi:hypothetical protein